MRRKERTKILVHCNQSFLKEWASKISKHEKIETIEKPSHSLTMVKMRESAQNSLFYLCEVLVSEARVECQGKIGIGIIQGTDLASAQYLAIIDAAYQANLEITKELDKALQKEKMIQDYKRQKKASQILKTKVDFETMNIEV